MTVNPSNAACIVLAAAIVAAGCDRTGSERAAAPSNPPLELRMTSYNIHHGAGADGKLDMRRIADAVTREKPDFVGLNEVDRCTRRSGGVDEAAELGRLAGLHATFAEAIPLQGGGYGNAVLSREKPISVERVPLPGREPRVLLLCEFAGFWFGTAHLDLRANITNQLKSVEIILGVVAEKSRTKPVFLTGDWNNEPDSETLKRMREFMTILSDESARTYTGFRVKPTDDEICIDYIAVDSTHAGKVSVKASRVKQDDFTSDHNPVFVTVDLADE